jgi:hypothetical protein
MSTRAARRPCPAGGVAESAARAPTGLRSDLWRHTPVLVLAALLVLVLAVGAGIAIHPVLFSLGLVALWIALKAARSGAAL